MTDTDDTLTGEQWRTILDDTDLATFGELVRIVEDADMIGGPGGPDPETLVERGIADDGPLTVDVEASGAFDAYRLGAGETNTQPAGSAREKRLEKIQEKRREAVCNHCGRGENLTAEVVHADIDSDGVDWICDECRGEGRGAK